MRTIEMIHDYVSRLSQKRISNPRYLRSFLKIEQLEGRVNPIVGQYLDPAVGYSAVSPNNSFLAAPFAIPNAGFGGIDNFDGVVKITGSSGLGSGSLISLQDGRSWGHHILSVQHVTDGGSTNAQFEMFRFTAAGNGAIAAVPINIRLRTGITFQVPSPDNADLAVTTLADPIGTADPNRLLIAPAGAQQYGLYGNTNEVNKQVVVAGYGLSGDGANGALASTKAGLPNPGFPTPEGRKRYGVNEIDNDVTITRGEALRFDFDSGQAKDDYASIPTSSTRGVVFGDLAPGQVNDVGIAPGDSGGPTFIGGLIAGVNQGTDPGGINPSGRLATAWGANSYVMRVSSYRPFIDTAATKGQYYVFGDGAGKPATQAIVTQPSTYDIVRSRQFCDGRLR